MERRISGAYTQLLRFSCFALLCLVLFCFVLSGLVSCFSVHFSFASLRSSTGVFIFHWFLPFPLTAFNFSPWSFVYTHFEVALDILPGEVGLGGK